MYVNDALNCCGVNEISDLQDLLHKKYKEKGLGWWAVKKSIGSCFFANSQYDVKKGKYVAVGPKEFHAPTAHIVFTDAHDRTERYGKMLAKYILKNKLGTVVGTKTRINPNSGNAVTAYIWTLDLGGCKAWCNENAQD